MNNPVIEAIRDWCIGKFQPKGDYLTSVPEEYVTEEEAEQMISQAVDNVSGGTDGFSPQITENEENTESIYKLDITTAEGTFTTPNLKGADGQDGVDGGITYSFKVQTEEPETVAENEIVLVVGAE